MSSLSIHSSYIRYYTDYRKALYPYMIKNSSVNQRLILLSLCIVLTGVFVPSISRASDSVESGFLNWYPKADLTAEEREGLMEFCRGAYRVPEVTPLSDNCIEAEADQTQINSAGEAIFTGSVVMRQQDQVLHRSEERRVGKEWRDAGAG